MLYLQCRLPLLFEEKGMAHSSSRDILSEQVFTVISHGARVFQRSRDADVTPDIGDDGEIVRARRHRCATKLSDDGC